MVERIKTNKNNNLKNCMKKARALRRWLCFGSSLYGQHSSCYEIFKEECLSAADVRNEGAKHGVTYHEHG